MLVAVAPTKFARGVEAPGTRPPKYPADKTPPTYDWRHALGSPLNTRPVPCDHEVQPLDRALAERYDSDAHLVTYLLLRDGCADVRQPRINKGGLQWVCEQGYTVEVGQLMCDVDNPNHGEWTPQLRTELAEQVGSLSVLQTCGIYLTQHGYRLIQPLDEPVVVQEVERYIATWLDELEAAGLAPDRSCVDWTRVFRLPHVRRGALRYESPLVDLTRMVPRVIAPKQRPAVRSGGEPGGRAAR